VPPAEGPPPLPHMLSFQRGRELLQAGRPVEAARELGDALQRAVAAAPRDRQLHAQIDEALRQARSRIGVLYVSADKGRDILVDGTSIGEAPILGEILLAPGKHRVLARGDLCLGTADVDLRVGEVRGVQVPCKSAPSWRTPALVTGLVASVVGIGLGVVTLAIAEGRRNEVNQIAADARTFGYVEPSAVDRAAGVERERVDFLNTSITSFLIGGGLLAATTAVFFAVPRRRPAEPPPLVGATVGVGQAGLWMRW
jgi:hypothetical protein